MSSSAISGIHSAKLGLWLPEPNDSLTQTLCKVYGIGLSDPLLKEVVALHLALNPEIFAAHRPLQQKAIYLADLQLQRGGALGASQQSALFNGVPQSLRPDPITISAAERIKQVAGAAKFGGAALVLVDGALTCQKLSATPQTDKVQTAYKEIGGFAGSLLTGAAVGIAVASMATPVGWVGAIVISAGSAYGGKMAGEIVGMHMLKKYGDLMSLKDGRVLNKWCD